MISKTDQGKSGDKEVVWLRRNFGGRKWREFELLVWRDSTQLRWDVTSRNSERSKRMHAAVKNNYNNKNTMMVLKASHRRKKNDEAVCESYF